MGSCALTAGPIHDSYILVSVTVLYGGTSSRENVPIYISECEKRLTDATTLFPINREGAYYLKSYPWLKNIADYIFVLGFPFGYIVLCVTKIVNEWDWTTPLKYVDIIVLCLIIFFSVVYFKSEVTRRVLG